MENIQLIETVEKAIRWAIRNRQDYVIMKNINNEDEPYYITSYASDNSYKNPPNYVMDINYSIANVKSAKEILEIPLTESN